jgi:hypothetical protein
MTHFHVLVVGPADQLAGQLAPFDENVAVEPYFEPISEQSLTWMREHYGIAADAPVEEYADKVMDWMSRPPAIRGGVLGTMSTYNPNSKWDYWAEVDMPVRYGSGPTFTKAQLDIDALGNANAAGGISADITIGEEGVVDTQGGSHGQMPGVPFGVAAVVAEGVWHSPGQVGWFGSTTATDETLAQFALWFRRFWDAMPDDCPMTVVDCHI